MAFYLAYLHVHIFMAYLLTFFLTGLSNFLLHIDFVPYLPTMTVRAGNTWLVAYYAVELSGMGNTGRRMVVG